MSALFATAGNPDRFMAWPTVPMAIGPVPVIAYANVVTVDPKMLAGGRFGAEFNARFRRALFNDHLAPPVFINMDFLARTLFHNHHFFTAISIVNHATRQTAGRNSIAPEMLSEMERFMLSPG